jgi:hypothetical protein
LNIRRRDIAISVFLICLLHACIALELLLLRASCSVSVQISGGLTYFVHFFFAHFLARFSCSCLFLCHNVWLLVFFVE